MTKRIPVLLCFVAIGSSAALRAAEPAQPARAAAQNYVRECTDYSLIGDRMYALPVTRQEIEEAPLWSPDGGDEPPISAGEAIRSATKEFAAHFKGAEDWELADALLAPICLGRWAWLSVWQPKQRGRTGSVHVLVLMSGAVIPIDRLAPSDQRE